MTAGTTVLAVAIAVLLSRPPAAQQPTAEAKAPVALQGRVVDMRGEPVPGAEVWVTTWHDETRLAAGKCDGDGCFKLNQVPARDLWLVNAHAAGKCTCQDFVRRPEEPALIVLHEAATLRGVLRNRAGEPVPGAIVKAIAEMRDLRPEAYATTDASGAFTISVALGRMRICAVVPGDGLSIVTQDVTGDGEITLERFPHPLTALQVAVDGLPPNGPRVGVSLLPNGMSSRVPPPWDFVFLDERGVGRLPELPDVDYTLRPYGPGLVFAPDSLRVKRGEGPHQVRFQVSRGDATSVAWRGIVRDAEGKPVSGMRLAMRKATEARTAEAVTADDGTLTFRSHQPAGTQVIVYSLDPRFTVDPVQDALNLNTEPRYLNRQVCPVDPAVRLELRVVPACSVEGRLLLADGRAAPFVLVHVEEENGNRGPRWMSFATARSDREGRFRFTGLHHFAQAVRVQVTDRAGAVVSEPFAMARPGSALQLGDVPLAAPATIDGVVRDAKGAPAPGVRVWLLDWDLATRQQRSGSVVEVVTDRQGRYRFVGVPPGGAWLELVCNSDQPTGRGMDPFAVEAGEKYTVDLVLPAR